MHSAKIEILGELNVAIARRQGTQQKKLVTHSRITAKDKGKSDWHLLGVLLTWGMQCKWHLVGVLATQCLLMMPLEPWTAGLVKL